MWNVFQLMFQLYESNIFFFKISGVCTPIIHSGDFTTSAVFGLFKLSYHYHRKTIWNSKLNFRNNCFHVWNWKCHYCHFCVVSRITATYSCMDWNGYVNFPDILKGTICKLKFHQSLKDEAEHFVLPKFWLNFCFHRQLHHWVRPTKPTKIWI